MQAVLAALSLIRISALAAAADLATTWSAQHGSPLNTAPVTIREEWNVVMRLTHQTIGRLS